MLRQRSHSQRAAVGDRVAIPQRTILLFQRHQLARGRVARSAACVVQQQQRQQAQHFGFGDLALRLAQQRPQQPRQADGFVGQRRSVRRMPFVEHQVHHPQHAGQARRPLGRARHFVRDARRGDLGLGAHDALRQRGRGEQKGAGNRLGRQAADLAQRQRDARFFGQARMAAGEHQAQAVVFDRIALVDQLLAARRVVGHRFSLFGGFVPTDEAFAAADAVDGLEPAG